MQNEILKKTFVVVVGRQPIKMFESTLRNALNAPLQEFSSGTIFIQGSELLSYGFHNGVIGAIKKYLQERGVIESENNDVESCYPAVCLRVFELGEPIFTGVLQIDRKHRCVYDLQDYAALANSPPESNEVEVMPGLLLNPVVSVRARMDQFAGLRTSPAIRAAAFAAFAAQHQ